MLQTFVWWVVSLEGDYLVGGTNLSYTIQTSINFHKFAELYLHSLKGAMSHTAHVRDEVLHLENVRQLFQVLRVIQYQEFIVIYLSHPLTVRIVIR